MQDHPMLFVRAHLPRPLNTEYIQAFFERFATDAASNGVVFETQADEHGIRHLLGARTFQIAHVRRHLSELIPGASLTALGDDDRKEATWAGRISWRPRGLALDSADPVRVTRALYVALARKFGPGEVATIQLTLGEGHRPKPLGPSVPDPSTPWFRAALSSKPEPAPVEVRRRLVEHASQFRIDAVLRIGVAASSAERRRAIVSELLGALALTQSPGLSMTFRPESVAKFSAPAIPRSASSQLTPRDLVAIVGWPIGEDALPGMPALHPKILRPAASVHTKSRVFARSLAPGDDRRIGVSERDALTHLVAIGPTGSGKTTALYHFIENDIANGRAVVVLDPKDQMPQHLAGRIPKDRIDDVVIIDPSQSSPIGFNPLDVTDRDPDVVADGILAVFARSFESSWGPRTEDIFSASLRTLARTASTERPNTLVDLPRLWTDSRYRSAQLAQVSDDPGLMGFWNAFNALSPAAQANWVASPMNKLRSILLRPAAVKILGQRHPRFRLRDAFRERKIVLISLNEGLIGPLTSELLGSLVIAELWQATQERAAERDADKHPAFIYVDEADRFMHLPISLGDALARSRSLSVGWSLAVQYWDQLPREMRSAIKSNARSKIAWAMSSDDDARTFARLAPGLTELDFMSLGRFQVYANLVADGMPSGWATAVTLPPSKQFSKPSAVRARSHVLYGPTRESGGSQHTHRPASESSTDGPEPEQPTGRRRRS